MLRSSRPSNVISAIENVALWPVHDEKDNVVYLELEGVLVDVVMIDSAWAKAGTVLLRLPNATARQLGLLPHMDQVDIQPEEDRA